LGLASDEAAVKVIAGEALVGARCFAQWRDYSQSCKPVTCASTR
jgi:hypothetical protein